MCVSMIFSLAAKLQKYFSWKLTWIHQVQFFTGTDADSSFLKTFTIGPYFNGACQFKVGFFLGHGQESSSGF